MSVSTHVTVGQIIEVGWSNGAGVTHYRIVDNPDAGPHIFEKVGDFEWADNKLVPVDLGPQYA